jgi:hypothetical protein
MVDLPDAQDRLGPLRQLIIDAYLSAWETWRKLLEHSEFSRPLSTTTRANFIHDHVCLTIDAAIDDLQNVTSTKALEFYALRIDSDILLRFKCVQHGVPSNVKTHRQKRLARQIYTRDEVLALVGEDEALIAPTLLTAGYTIDGDAIGRIEIRRDCQPGLPWSFDLYGGDELVQPLVLDGLEDETKPAIVASARKKAAEREDVAEQA